MLCHLVIKYSKESLCLWAQNRWIRCIGYILYLAAVDIITAKDYKFNSKLLEEPFLKLVNDDFYLLVLLYKFINALHCSPQLYTTFKKLSGRLTIPQLNITHWTSQVCSIHRALLLKSKIQHFQEEEELSIKQVVSQRD